MINYTLRDDNSLRVVEKTNNGSLTLGDDAVITFDDIIDKATYTLSGAFFSENTNRRTKAQTDSKMVEIESAKATLADVLENGEKDAHIHFNVIHKDETSGKDGFEIDAIIHSNKEDAPNATAYVLEAAYSPQPRKVKQLLENVEKLKKSAQSSSSHYHNCTTFVPVLGGKFWSKETTAMCKANNPPIWRVKPSGASYQVRRTFSTSAIKIVTFIFK